MLPKATPPRKAFHEQACSLIELPIVVAMITMLMSMAIPAYQNFTERSQVRAAEADIGRMQLELNRWLLSTQNPVPASLADAGITMGNDPWGNPYQFRRLDGTNPGTVRKDSGASALNSDFDLYSMGRDGNSAAPLSAESSLDDIVRARNGDYVGRADKY